jgi:hypothetical protein
MVYRCPATSPPDLTYSTKPITLRLSHISTKRPHQLTQFIPNTNSLKMLAHRQKPKRQTAERSNEEIINTPPFSPLSSIPPRHVLRITRLDTSSIDYRPTISQTKLATSQVNCTSLDTRIRLRTLGEPSPKTRGGRIRKPRVTPTSGQRRKPRTPKHSHRSSRNSPPRFDSDDPVVRGSPVRHFNDDTYLEPFGGDDGPSWSNDLVL